MALGNFYDIMVGIVGVPVNDIESTILYFIAAIVGTSFIFLGMYLFLMSASLFLPRR